MFFPNFLKPLTLAVVVAENMNDIILSQPAMQLLEKFTTLRLGDWQFRRALGQRTKRIERIKLRIVDFSLRIGFASFYVFKKLN